VTVGNIDLSENPLIDIVRGFLFMVLLGVDYFDIEVNIDYIEYRKYAGG